MPNRQVYGKHTTAREHRRAAECFAASSSPSKPLQSPPAKDFDLPVTKKAETDEENKIRTQNASTEKEEEFSLDAVVQGLGCLQLERQPQEEIPGTEDASESVFDVSVLNIRDPNSTRTRKPRRWQGREREKTQVLQGRTNKISENSLLLEAREPGADAVSKSLPLQESREARKSKDDNTAKHSLPANARLIAREKPKSPSSPRHQHQIARHTAPPSNTDSAELLAYTKPLLNLCGDPSARLAPADFQDWADALSVYFKISKIAEASYGEVYRLSLFSSIPGFLKTDESVLKIIALKQPPQFAETPAQPGFGQPRRKPLRESKKQLAMSAVADVASEVRLLQRMSPVPGWTNFREFHLVRGRLPTQFVRAWKDFNNNVKTSEFTDPSKKGSYDEEQLWAVIEMQDAGMDLETMLEKEEMRETVRDVDVVWDVFWGVACAVAKGEEWACFEHRDLHLGNICIRPTTPLSPRKTLHRKLGFTGLETTIIDYTLSRAFMTNTTPSSPSHHKGSMAPLANETAYFDLSKDPAIFKGDAAQDYQYAIYRFMRSAVLLGDPAAEFSTPATARKKGSKLQNSEADSWRQHHPLTNLVWLHFVLHTLLVHLAKPASSPPIHPLVTPTAQRRRAELHDKLQSLARKLDVKALKDCGFGSAAELVEWAVAEGWLDLEDVVGHGQDGDGLGAVGEGAAVQAEKDMEGPGKEQARPRAQRRRRRQRS